MFVRDRLVVSAPDVTAANLASSETLFRLSIVTDLIVYGSVLLLVWTLYRILRPVRPDLALLLTRGLKLPLSPSGVGLPDR